MNKPLHNEDLIIRYLDGELSAEELQQFHELMQKDPGFRQEVDSMQFATESVKYYGIKTTVATVRAEMITNGAKHPIKVVGIKKFIRYGLLVAATLFFVFIAIEGYQFYRLSPDAVYEEIYLSYSTVTRGSQSASAIEKAYSEKSYNEVVRLGANEPASDKEKFLIGLSYLEMDQPGNAIQWFAALNNSQSGFKEDAEFYLGLSYLKQRNYERSLNFFESIYNSPSHSYHKRVSKSLLRKIRMLDWK